MQKYKVSSEDLKKLYAPETKLATIFHDIERELNETQQVVCQFIINGMELSEHDEVRFSKVSLDEIDTLEYLSEKSNDLIYGVLESWLLALPEMMLKTENLALILSQKGPQGQIKKIHDLMENFEYLISSAVSLKKVLGDHLSTVHIPWDSIEEMNRKSLLEAFKCVQNKDFVQLAYVLEYDLIACLEKWKSVLTEIHHHIGGANVEQSAREETKKASTMGRTRYSC